MDDPILSFNKALWKIVYDDTIYSTHNIENVAV